MYVWETAGNSLIHFLNYTVIHQDQEERKPEAMYLQYQDEVSWVLSTTQSMCSHFPYSL